MIPLMNDTQAAEWRRRRRDFIRAYHPDRGSDPDAFIAGLRAFGAEPEQDAGPLPRVVVIRRRRWPIRQAIAVARRLREGPSAPRVH
jgi:hypothetical protein